MLATYISFFSHIFTNNSDEKNLCIFGKSVPCSVFNMLTWTSVALMLYYIVMFNLHITHWLNTENGWSDNSGSRLEVLLIDGTEVSSRPGAEVPLGPPC